MPSTSQAAWWKRLAPLAFAAVGSMVACFVLMQLWHAHYGVPFYFGGDQLASSLNVNQVAHNGWYWSDPRLAAPFTQHFQDWPIPDFLSLFLARFFGLFLNGWASVTNAIFLVSFPLIAMSSWWVLRKLGVAAWTASVLAILYAFLPYHLARAEFHLFLAGYYTVPFGVYIAYAILSGEALFPKSRSARNWLVGRVNWISVRTIVMAVLIGLTDTYYAAFTIVLVLVAVGVRMISARQFGTILSGALICALLVGSVGFELSGALLYRHQHGTNEQVVNRTPDDSETYGLKIAQMILPVPGHRIDALAKTRAKYDNFPLHVEGYAPALGVVASIGLLWMIGLAITGLLRPRIAGFDNDTHRQLSVLGVASIFVATIGGFATVIALYVTPEIRSWNRVSVFIGLMALAVVGLLLDSLFRRLSTAKAGRATIGRMVPAALLSVVLVAGLLDQTNKVLLPNFKGAGDYFLNDQSYFRQIETTLPKGASVFELPFMDFPEVPPVNGVQAYDLLRPYLSTKNLKWSFGGVKGRPEARWQYRLHDMNAEQLLQALCATGFSGVYIDRAGFTDNSLETEIAKLLGNQQPLVGQYQNIGAFYDLRAYAAKLQAQKPDTLAAEKTRLLSTDLSDLGPPPKS